MIGREAGMNPTLLKTLDKALDEVIDLLVDHGWEDEAAWYGELRDEILEADPESPRFLELLVELERSFLGIGTLTDIPLEDLPDLPNVHEDRQQRWGLVSCASGIVGEIKKSIR
jgi:hypothetical protein